MVTGLVLHDPSTGALLRLATKKFTHGTNNEAEYLAVAEALKYAHEAGATRVEVHSDSQLVVRQLDGIYSIKQGHLRKRCRDVLELARAFPDGVKYVWHKRDHLFAPVADAASKYATKDKLVDMWKVAWVKQSDQPCTTENVRYDLIEGS